MPVEPPPSPWAFPDPLAAGEDDVVCTGGDLEPGTVLAAYRSGLFPMHVDGGRTLAWWSPDPRGVLPLDDVRITRSLRQSCRRFEVRVDTAFEEVIDACADPSRNGRWINADIRAAYVRLHEMGWVHSVEAWSLSTGSLSGGLYGIAVGGFFAGESMFHRERDASKVALVGLVDLLRAGGAMLLDVQWRTEHLASLGAIEISRAEYMKELETALSRPLPVAWRKCT